MRAALRLRCRDLVNYVKDKSTILCQRITRMKLVFSNYSRDCSYSFQGSSELISVTVAVSLFLAECSYSI